MLFLYVLYKKEDKKKNNVCFPVFAVNVSSSEIMLEYDDGDFLFDDFDPRFWFPGWYGG